MTKEYAYTFDTWRRGQCSEVTHVSLDEAAGYQSEYVYKFNHLRDKGWKRVAGRWVSPRPPYNTYGHINLAFGSQSLYERLYEELESTD